MVLSFINTAAGILEAIEFGVYRPVRTAEFSRIASSSRLIFQLVYLQWSLKAVEFFY